MATNHNPYPNRPHPVGSLSYELGIRHMKNIHPHRRLLMLEFGEAEVLYDMPRIIGGGTIANLGHARGGSAILMGLCLKELELEGHVYSVDTFERLTGDDTKEPEARRNLAAVDVADYVTLCVGTTDEWAKKLAHKEFDFLFIDADHSYGGVLNDFKNWTPMVKVGGLVGFHDTNQDFSHRVLVEQVLDNSAWSELKELHINRVRVFRKEMEC